MTDIIETEKVRHIQWLVSVFGPATVGRMGEPWVTVEEWVRRGRPKPIHVDEPFETCDRCRSRFDAVKSSGSSLPVYCDPCADELGLSEKRAQWRAQNARRRAKKRGRRVLNV